MKAPLIGAMGLGFWLAAIPAMAQTPNPPQRTEKKGAEKPPQAAAPARQPTPAAPAVSPEELSHRAMVEEQERRDRDAEAERDRDDL